MTYNYDIRRMNTDEDEDELDCCDNLEDEPEESHFLLGWSVWKCKTCGKAYGRVVGRFFKEPLEEKED